MSSYPDDGFAPMEDVPEPLGPRRAPRKDASGCLKGCLIAAVVLAVLGVISLYACERLIERAVIDDPDEALALARRTADFALPEGYQAEGGMQLPVVGDFVFFTRPVEGQDGQSLLALGHLKVELDERELLENVGRASGQEAGELEVKSQPCTVGERQAVCIDATTVDRERLDAVPVRWQAVVIALGDGALVGAAMDQQARFDAVEATAFLQSLRPRE